jgi:protein phosphatase 1G
MGAYMSAPITEKHGEDGENNNFEYGVSSMQGWRIDMEDAHLACLDAMSGGDTSVASGIYGVFDGHGGREVALFCHNHMLEVWRSTQGLQEGDIAKSLVQAYLSMDELLMKPASYDELTELAKKPDKDGSFDSSGGGEDQSVSQAHFKQLLMGIKQGLNNKSNGVDGGAGAAEESTTLDAVDNMVEASGAEMRFENDRQRTAGPSAGCTAVVAVIAKDKLIVANAGDSRCVFSRKGRAVAMSRDHKPQDLDESDRIHKAGGFVTDGRVNGSLNLSRAIGDMEYKQRKDLDPKEHAVTCYPELYSCGLHKDDEFVILACDGIWDVLTNQEAVDFVRQRIGKMTLQKICEDICDRCLAPDTAGVGKGCDNMTVMVVKIKDPLKSKDTPVAEPKKITVAV